MSPIPYASALGSVMYAVVCTRLDISHVVGVVGKYMENLGREHWVVVKWLLLYLRGTHDYSITYKGWIDIVCGYVDHLNFAGDLDKKRSTLGYVFSLEGGTICWI